MVSCSEETHTPQNKKSDLIAIPDINLQQQPAFKGNFTEFVIKNLKYPEEAKKNRIEGKVVIAFDIDEKGLVHNPQVVQKAGFGFDEEALRIVRLFPPFVPALKDGKPHRVRLNMPIVFQLKQEESHT